MKYDEHGCIRESTEAERDAVCAEADAFNDGNDDGVLSFADRSLQQSLQINYDGHKELADFYKSQIAHFLTPAQMEWVEKYVNASVKALGTRHTMERLGLNK